MQPTISLALTILLWGAEPAAADQTVRATIERSLPFIRTEGQRWIDEKKCVTCHQIPFMVWSLNAAAEKGLAVDEEKLAAWNGWAIDWQNMATKQTLEKGERFTLGGSPDAVAQLLLGRTTNDQAKSTPTWPALFAECLAAGQQDDGSWKAGGQLPSQKRRPRETQEVTTMWALVALQSYASSDVSLHERCSKARDWLGSQTAGESTEWWAAKLLLESGSGNRNEANRIRDKLLASQHEDGGFGWLLKDESDAFGSGVALYALAREDNENSKSAMTRARDYLCRTQTADGSWPVKGTKKAKSHQVEPTATYWGTCWAVIGLAETLPKPEPTN